jgi:hypothetical protein
MKETEATTQERAVLEESIHLLIGDWTFKTPLEQPVSDSFSLVEDVLTMHKAENIARSLSRPIEGLLGATERRSQMYLSTRGLGDPLAVMHLQGQYWIARAIYKNDIRAVDEILAIPENIDLDKYENMIPEDPDFSGRIYTQAQTQKKEFVYTKLMELVQKGIEIGNQDAASEVTKIFPKNTAYRHAFDVA